MTIRIRLPRKADHIFEVALRHLAERGYQALTVEGIAGDAGVNKTTIYRWWPNKDELLAAAVSQGSPLAFTIPDTGSLEDDVVSVLREIAALLTFPQVQAIIAGAVEGDRPALAALAERFVDTRLTSYEELLTRAVTRGEVPSTVTPAQLMHPLIGALWIQVLLLRREVSDDYLRSLTRTIIAGLRSEEAHIGPGA